MKTLITIACILSANSAFALAGPLDGKTFCRQVQTGGMFGQPAGARKNCISFDKGFATDNANSFFGNPPSVEAYQTDGTKVTFGQSSYVLIDQGITMVAVQGSATSGTTYILEF